MNITYQVQPVGKIWRVIDRSKGGEVVGFGGTYQSAVKTAEDLESRQRITTQHLIESGRQKQSLKQLTSEANQECKPLLCNPLQRHSTTLKSDLKMQIASFLQAKLQSFYGKKALKN